MLRLDADAQGRRPTAEGDASPRDHRGRRPADELKGATPGQTFYSVIYSESKRPDGLVVQTGRGSFKLNPRRRKAAA
jgi:hypothetical protein